jgi:hypothetical protein
VAKALHRKVNKDEIDELMAKKAEISDINQLFRLIETKAEGTHLTHLQNIVDTKVDRLEL